MAKHEQIVVGTEIKLKINIEPIGDLTMDDYDFKVEAYCNPRKSVLITKENIESQNGSGGRLDDGSYYVCIDTALIGIGNLKVKVTAFLPDGAFNDAKRTEVAIINTNMIIINDV